jgi:hypothetical protein
MASTPEVLAALVREFAWRSNRCATGDVGRIVDSDNKPALKTAFALIGLPDPCPEEEFEARIAAWVEEQARGAPESATVAAGRREGGATTDGPAQEEGSQWMTAWGEAEAIVQRWLDAYPEDVWPPIGEDALTSRGLVGRAGAHMARHVAREILRQFAEARRG